MKRKYRIITLLLLFIFTIPQLTAKNIKGIILDKASKEPLIGATIQVIGTETGAITDIDGNFVITGLTTGKTYEIEVKYISYKPLLLAVKANDNAEPLICELDADTQTLADVTIVARKNLEGDKALLQERQKAVFAIENIGAKEMSMKGISNVSDGVKKITGISIASAGQLIVRGLGDRYSTTTLNGLPIASPNPDHKLIPLDLFPTSTVKNITISKVFEVGSFADYSGAHVDIGTKENTTGDFFSISANTGGNSNTLFKDFYHSDRKGTMFSNNKIDRKYLNMSNSDFKSTVKQQDIFGTSFSISKRTALPDFGISAGGGKEWNIGNQKLNLLASLGIKNDTRILSDAYITTLTAQGTQYSHFDYDSYTSKLEVAALASMSYTLRKADRINYTLFYARNAIDNYMRREGTDAEKVNLIGSNSIFQAYQLLNNQLIGHHEFGDKWFADWSASYGITGSDEPDRRQVMFRKNDDGRLSLFKLNRQETMRYFGELDEKEFVADIRGGYLFGDNNRIRFGGTYKDKNRDYTSVRFYYNLNSINPDITDIYDTDGYLNQENIANGTLGITRNDDAKYTYYAGNDIYAGFVDVDYYIRPALLVNLGVRYENSQQWVRYWSDSSIEKRSELNTNDFFPALNLKYTFNPSHTLRLSASKTVTRPSFIEMAPFLYKASYGSAEMRGNENLENGYNYNIDLRYEFFPEGSSDMFSITGYYKKLDSPIERIQKSSGGSTLYTFRNSESGMAAGVELEIRKELFKNFRAGVNGSYMYTNVNLTPGEGIYTDTQRQLQGASPYLFNADISYNPRFDEHRQLALALMYNLQGPRINTVGVYEAGNIVQEALHTLDFVGSYEFNRHFSMKIQCKNLLNNTVKFTQELPKADKELTVEEFKLGMDAEIGFTYKF